MNRVGMSRRGTRPISLLLRRSCPYGVQAGSIAPDHNGRFNEGSVVVRILIGRSPEQSAAEKLSGGFHCTSWRSETSQPEAPTADTWSFGSCNLPACEAEQCTSNENPTRTKIRTDACRTGPWILSCRMSQCLEARTWPEPSQSQQRRGGGKMNRSCTR